MRCQSFQQFVRDHDMALIWFGVHPFVGTGGHEVFVGVGDGASAERDHAQGVLSLGGCRRMPCRAAGERAGSCGRRCSPEPGVADSRIGSARRHDQVFCRHPHIVKEHIGTGDAAKPEQVFLLSKAEAFTLLGDQESADALCTFVV